MELSFATVVATCWDLKSKKQWFTVAARTPKTSHCQDQSLAQARPEMPDTGGAIVEAVLQKFISVTLWAS